MKCRIILRGTRIAIPKNFHKRTLQLEDESFLDVIKTKALARKMKKK